MTLNDATRRGAELSLERDVRDVLGAAAMQLARSVEFSRSEEAAETAGGRISGRDYIPMIVTLDHGGPISAGIRTPGFVEAVKHGQVPWSLSLLDLYTLVQLLESSWQFKHYARRRLLAAAEGRQTMAYDELDFYHNYRYLNVCAMPNGLSHFVMVAHTNEVDDYFNSLDSRKRRKPARAINSVIRGLIEDLERRRSPGWSDVVCDLLDLSHSVAEALAATMARRQNRIKNGGTSVATLRQPDRNFGLIYVATTAERLSDAVILAQIQTAPMSGSEETHLIIVHDPIAGRVLHEVYKRVGPAWTLSRQSALHLGEDGLLLSLP